MVDPCVVAACRPPIPPLSTLGTGLAHKQEAHIADSEGVRGGPQAFKRGAADAVLQVDLRPVPQQQLDQPLVAVDGGVNKRGAAVRFTIGVGSPPSTALRACRVPCQEQNPLCS